MLGNAAICLRIVGGGLKDCACQKRNFQLLDNGFVYGVTGWWDGRVYEKNGYHQTHIEPERRYGYIYMKKIDREMWMVRLLSLNLPLNIRAKDKLLRDKVSQRVPDF